MASDCKAWAFDPKRERLVSGSYDKTLRLWEATTGKSLATLEGHTDKVTCVAFDPSGQRLISGSDDKSIVLWELVRTDERKWQILYRLTAAWPLFAAGAFLQGAQLSDQNKRLLLQRGAKEEAPPPSLLLETSEKSARLFVSFWTRGKEDVIPVSISERLEPEEQRSLGCVNQASYGFFKARRPVPSPVAENSMTKALPPPVSAEKKAILPRYISERVSFFEKFMASQLPTETPPKGSKGKSKTATTTTETSMTASTATTNVTSSRPPAPY